MPPTTKRPGGRTERTRQAVLEAALDVLQASGSDGLTVEAISERSGVHKTTIYRRWGSADEVFFDVVSERAKDAIPIEATGDAHADLIGMARDVVANIEDPVGRAIAAVALARPHDHAYVSLVQRFWRSRLSQASAIVTVAQDEGGVAPGIDPDVAVRSVASMLWFQVMVLRDSVTDRQIEAIVTRALSPS
ncbi:MAG: TetR family transcriptional regulator [Proteobacteria bacterium]|nr:TetR family transcriptional regulator [Pseudomonadota bacterium]